jgi:hypothetical protein
MFKNIPNRQRVGLIWTITLMAIAISLIVHWGIIDTYVPDSGLVQNSLLAMGAAFTFSLLFVGWPVARMLDRCVISYNQIKADLDDDLVTDKYQKIANLFSGKVVNDGTWVTRFVKRTVKAKTSNLSQKLEVKYWLNLLYDDLVRPIKMMHYMAGMLVKLGLIGTFLGLVVSLAQNFSQLGSGFDEAIGLAIVTGMVDGLSTAFLTTLLGMVLGGVVLDYLATSMQNKAEEIVGDVEVQYRSIVTTNVNDEKAMAEIFALMKDMDYESFIHGEALEKLHANYGEADEDE